MWSTIGEIAACVLIGVAAFVTPVSDRRKYGPWRQGARDSMHWFAYTGLFRAVPEPPQRDLREVYLAAPE